MDCCTLSPESHSTNLSYALEYFHPTRSISVAPLLDLILVSFRRNFRKWLRRWFCIFVFFIHFVVVVIYDLGSNMLDRSGRVGEFRTWPLIFSARNVEQWNEAKQSKAKQSNATQSKAKQSKARQSKAKQQNKNIKIPTPKPCILACSSCLGTCVCYPVRRECAVHRRGLTHTLARHG